MSCVNSFRFIGEATSGPLVKATSSGAPIVTIMVGTKKWRRNGDGKGAEVITLHEVCLVAKVAEFAQKNIVRGDTLVVDGEVGYRDRTIGGQQMKMATFWGNQFRIIGWSKERQKRKGGQSAR